MPTCFHACTTRSVLLPHRDRMHTIPPPPQATALPAAAAARTVAVYQILAIYIPLTLPPNVRFRRFRRAAGPAGRQAEEEGRRSSGRRYRAAAAPRARTPPSTPRTPHALAKHRRQQRRRRTSNARRHARTTTNDDEKMLRALTGAKPKTPIDGACENLVVAPATGPRCARGPLPSSSHASVA